VEERVHPHEKHGRDQAQADREPGIRLDDSGENPQADIEQNDACDLPEAATSVDLEVRREVVLPAPAAWNFCGVHGEVSKAKASRNAFARRDDSDHDRGPPGVMRFPRMTADFPRAPHRDD
jgi:hypothetical protein